ncbi:MAG TPA: NAD(P)H-dependent oxidoreductase subunit E [bacterium]|nr:NAD(P)H-dependent oxidoreductase subunit E [bacterium]
MRRRDTILGDMHAVQARAPGTWIPPDELKRLARSYGISMADAAGVASYYSMLSLKPRGRHLIRVCASPVCRLFGSVDPRRSVDIITTISRLTGAPAGGTDPSGSFTLETTQCLGRCAGAPSMMLDDTVYGKLDPERVAAIIAGVRAHDQGHAGATVPETCMYADDIGPSSGMRTIFRFPPDLDATSADQYGKAGGWSGIKAALRMAPDVVVGQLAEAKVRGRGGAGFPTGLKERATAGSACSDEAGCERYVVCNADEGEPGTFKDRIIMERLPMLLIEGMIISAYAIGARQGYVYIRGEYTHAIERVSTAIESARAAGFLGARILGTDFSFDLVVRPGAGSYLCGEELTLIESLEGKRGSPRIKPPFPAESGLWGKPTLVNNVETIASLPWVLEHGAAAYLRLGTASSPGTKLFCVSGDVARPGYGEWQMGVSLGDIIAAAGGVVDPCGKPAKQALAVLLGGAAGTFVPGERLDLLMDYDALKAAGATLGSGAIIVLGPGRSVTDSISAIMDFFKHESCGKCVPCRVGTARLAQRARSMAQAARSGSFSRDDLESMVDDADRIAKASLCPLGQSPILSLRSAARNLTRLF